jgi:hypothetical protein
MESNPIDYFYPNGGWGGYARFFTPSVHGRVGEAIINNVCSALKLNDSTSCLMAIAMLSCEHTKQIYQKGHKGAVKTIVCFPTEEAKVAIRMLKLQLRNISLMSSFTDQKQRIATEEDLVARWCCGKLGEKFRCYLCGYKFKFGDKWRFVYGGVKHLTNFITCEKCDGEDVLERWVELNKMIKEKLWWLKE